MHQLLNLKVIAAAIILLSATNSFCQYTPATIYEHPHTNYYPHDHDSAVTVRPSLIKQNFLYFGFLSPINQHISFEFAHQMSDDIILCGQLGIINSGFSQNSNNTNNIYAPTNTTSGAYVEAGVKLFFNPDYTRDGRHGYYTVEGFYLKPLLCLSFFSTTSTTYQSYYVVPPPVVTNNYSYSGAALTICLGGQWMIAHVLSIDLYAGAGVGFSNENSNNLPFTDNYFGFLMSTGVPLTLTGGVNIGLPF